MIDPVARSMLTAWADELGLPYELVIGVHLGECDGDLDAVGDGGRSGGGLQMNTEVWGHDPAYWSGRDGLARSIAALRPQWRRASAPLRYDWQRMSRPQRIAAFARFWATAQIADPALVAARAAEVYDRAEQLLAAEPAPLPPEETAMPANLDVFRHRSAWAFTWTPGTQAERDGAAIAATLGRYGITAFWQEAYYGLAWQGEIDRRTNGGVYGAPQNLLEFRALAERLAADGITLLPVVVPLGLAGEAEAHAEVARACGAVVVDMESDSSGHYWPWERAHQVRIYARALREAAGPDVAICWEPDGRLADAGRAAEWEQLVEPVRPYVNVWSPQLYAGWPAYGVGQRAIEGDIARFERFAALGPVCPTLYLSEHLSEPAALWRAFGPRSLGLCAFRFGAMDAQALTLLGSFPIAAPPPPRPAPEPPQADPRIREAIDGLTAIALGLDDLAERAQIQAAAARGFIERLVG